MAQRRGFREYLTGLLAPRDRNKTLTCLPACLPGGLAGWRRAGRPRRWRAFVADILAGLYPPAVRERGGADINREVSASVVA
ncbi:hypothetical protein FF36_03972 [Frankia torreyi]|uniref:DDE superfamily endonuclease n=1 Tax=Frankia torreyi TaxID=1856 RepID=A0A0D8BBX5_9ACTN|nr:MULTISPECIES: hypothetical protein [Frankia]KJE21768.1 hypothetical protein FF36_03972 [Frankia torreyi]KQM03315.1 hypothetical protein FF86_104356 [Frankia sp. CpI1-P]